MRPNPTRLKNLLDNQRFRPNQVWYDTKDGAYVTLSHVSPQGVWYGRYESGIMWPLDTNDLVKR